METKDTMKIEKKVYTAPELMEHGNFIEVTQGLDGDGLDAFGGSQPANAPIPF